MASDLVLHCLAMSHKINAMLNIWVEEFCKLYFIVDKSSHEIAQPTFLSFTATSSSIYHILETIHESVVLIIFSNNKGSVK